ncbi:hypothetical protein KIN20_029599 [Parelaphostrongylus tenuis]|uniref:Uncharacterized protein n=1 Tax=Parelaphostrongylus tenuis TaxID=148309 RepID=A0AAD5WFT2_PARTN|nr:hypothetical protein KIN20_029599 [Parelaphostrongylus tenuis]
MDEEDIELDFKIMRAPSWNTSQKDRRSSFLCITAGSDERSLAKHPNPIRHRFHSDRTQGISKLVDYSKEQPIGMRTERSKKYHKLAKIRYIVYDPLTEITLCLCRGRENIEESITENQTEEEKNMGHLLASPGSIHQLTDPKLSIHALIQQLNLMQQRS